MKGKTILKGIITAALLVFMVLIFNKPTEVYASQSDASNLSIDERLWIDAYFFIQVKADIYVEYEWDEGDYGWITFMRVTNVRGDGGTTIDIDKIIFVGESSNGNPTQYKAYFFYGTGSLGVYTGNIHIGVSVDEWGNIDTWIEYVKISEPDLS